MFLQGLVAKDKLLFWFKGRSMNSQNTNTADDILDVIEMAIEKYTGQLRNNFIRTTVQEISSDYKYKVGINGAYYKVISGCGMQFNAGDSVWVHIPEGDFTRAYICASATARYIERETIVNVTEQLLANYVQLQFLQSNYVNKTDLNSTYVTKTLLTQSLNGYITEQRFNTALSAYITSTTLNDVLANYVSYDKLTENLKQYITTSIFNSTLLSYVTISNLGNILNDYITKADSQAIFGNLLSNYYTKDEADSLFEPKSTEPDPTPDPDPGTDPDTGGGDNTDDSSNTEQNNGENDNGGGE